LFKILKKVGDDRREEIERRVVELITHNPRLTRLGALYILGEELKAFEATTVKEYVVPIAKLVGGLSSVNIMCRVLGKRGPLRSGLIEYAYLRVGDNTGVISAIVWSECLRRMQEMNVDVGDVLIMKDAYTKESVDGKTELHLGRSTVIKKIENSDIRPLEEFFNEELPQDDREVEVDVKAKIVGISEEFTIDLQQEKVTLRESLLLVGNRLLSMTAWREQVNLLKNLTSGQTVLIAAARYSKNSLNITPKTCIVPIVPLSGPSLPDLEITVLDKVETADNRDTYITACLDYILLARHDSLEPGRNYVVKKYGLIYENRKWILIPFELSEREGAASTTVQCIYDLSELSENLPYVCIEGRIESKTPLATQRLKSGEELEALNFWLTDGESNIYCRAFGKNASLLNSIPEGSKIRLKWVRVRKTRSGNLEVVVEEVSKVERLKED